MRTDWALVRRLASELHARLRGARVQDAALLSDGRPAIQFWTRGRLLWLCMDLFGSPPIVTLESEVTSVRDEPGFTRTLARTLHGASLLAVEARDRDRLALLRFGTRSRFGVTHEVDLYIELVPRFGNAVLVKSGTVVDAFKEFSDAQRRMTSAGLPYELPPLPEHPFTLVDATEFPPDKSVLDIFAEYRAHRIAAGEIVRTNRQRAALEKRIARRLARVESAIGGLTSREAEMERREALRAEGEAIYARLHELDAAMQAVEKERAAKIFARYKKLATSLPHLEMRRATLSRQREALETLLWEAQRTPDASLPEVESAFETLDRPARAKPAARAPRRREHLVVRTPSGSRILVGRSPLENAEITFKIARPNDLWFHARGMPGAHVVLARDDREAPPHEDVELAAALAAGHSKGRGSAKVTVDYTQRKHVRKQPGAAPGLVTYSEAKSIAVEPKTG